LTSEDGDPARSGEARSRHATGGAVVEVGLERRHRHVSLDRCSVEEYLLSYTNESDLPIYLVPEPPPPLEGPAAGFEPVAGSDHIQVAGSDGSTQHRVGPGETVVLRTSPSGRNRSIHVDRPSRERVETVVVLGSTSAPDSAAP